MELLLRHVSPKNKQQRQNKKKNDFLCFKILGERADVFTTIYNAKHFHSFKIKFIFKIRIVYNREKKYISRK